MSRTQKSHPQLIAGCAYHTGHSITNFCKCRQCLLPVCALCMQLHSQQHRGKGSVPRFEEIGNVIAQIDQIYSSLAAQIQRLKEQLLEMQKDKKINQIQMRTKLLQHRNRLVNEFEQSLFELENNLISQIVQDDKSFIQELKSIDNHLSLVSRNIKTSRAQLASDSILKEIILFFSKEAASTLQSELHTLKATAQQLIRSNVIVTVEDSQLSLINSAIQKFIQIDISPSNSL